MLSIKNYLPLLTWGLALFIALGVSLHVRLYPLRHHIWSPTQEQASMLVVQKIQENFFLQALQQNPSLDQATAMNMAQAKLNETLRSSPQKIREAINNVNNQLVKQLNGKPPVYLLESDPYYFYNLTENIITTGHMASTVKGSKYLNPLMNAPFGDWQPLSLHPWVGAITFKALRFIDANMPLMTALSFLPLLITSLILLVFFMTCRRLNLGPGVTLIASLLFSLAPVFLKRSAFGWYDTDPYNLLFPLIMINLLLSAFYQKHLKKTLLIAILFGITTTAHALIWQGWPLMYIISLLLTAGICAYAFFLLKNKTLLKHSFYFILCSSLTSIIAIGLCFGPKEFFVLIKEALDELIKFSPQGISPWPSLFLTVGELKNTTALGFWQATGGFIILSLGLGGFILTANHLLRNYKKQESIPSLVLIIISLILFFLASRTERFALFALMPLSLLSAVSLKEIHRLTMLIAMPQLAKQGLIAIVFLSLSVLLIARGNKQIALEITPIYNNTWEEALQAIKAKTPPDAIINSWWPPGHFIKATAQRKVAFDGATLDESATGYWMSNILLSPDEAHAQGLLRMLNLSGNRPIEYLTNECGLKLSQAAALLHAIAPRNKDDAAPLLKPFLKSDQINRLLLLTHGGHPKSYLLIYNEMVDDNLIFKFSGGWSFSKVEAINANPSLVKQIPPRNSPIYIEFLWDIAGGRSKYSSPLNLQGKNGNDLLFKDNLIINLETKDAMIDSPEFGKGRPLSVVYLENSQVKEHLINNNNLNYSVLLYQTDGKYQARLMDRSIANSLLIKLFFFDGKGLTYFKPLGSSKDLTGRTEIRSFEVLWND